MSTDSIPIVAITGNALRHRWAIWQLNEASRIELRGVARERKRPLPGGMTAEEDALVSSHFAERQAAEERYFGEAPELDELGVPVLDVEFGHSNDPGVADGSMPAPQATCNSSAARSSAHRCSSAMPSGR